MQLATSSPLLPMIVFFAALALLLLVLYLRARGKLQAFKPIADLQAEAKRLTESLRVIERQKERLDSEMESARARLKDDGLKAQEEMESARARFKHDALEAQAEIDTMQAELVPLRERMDLVEHGLYEPLYDFDSSWQYEARLNEIREAQKAMIKEKAAVLWSIQWSVGDSRAAGKKMENEYTKLMLRAFNGECDALIMKVKYNNVLSIEKRLGTLFDAVNKLGKTNTCEISRDFYRLKVQELKLVHEHEEKKQAEAEEQRQIREQMREEERAMREIERAIMEAEREETRYEKALEKARYEAEQATGAKHAKLAGEIERLQALLDEAHQNRERAKSRAEMTRSGYVYIISNIGSFGEDVYKIGMTRRLDPMDRVAELGDASVPFTFDVHAMIFSEDAPRLEAALHRAFDSRRVNRINLRKEFFRVSLDEIQKVALNQKADIQFTLAAEAKDFRQSQAMPTGSHRPTPSISA